jgi:hypothetical protein
VCSRTRSPSWRVVSCPLRSRPRCSCLFARLFALLIRSVAANGSELALDCVASAQRRPHRSPFHTQIAALPPTAARGAPGPGHLHAGVLLSSAPSRLPFEGSCSFRWGQQTLRLQEHAPLGSPPRSTAQHRDTAAAWRSTAPCPRPGACLCARSTTTTPTTAPA